MKIIVAHPGRQHSFKMATALKREGILFKYITTVYDKKSSITNKLVKYFLKGDILKKAKGRSCEELDDNDVLQYYEFFALITIFLSKNKYLKVFYSKWNVWVASKFYKKVMKYAKKNNVDAIIVYDGVSNKHFEILNNTNIKKIIDVSFASRQYLKSIFEKEMKLYPEFNMKDSFKEYKNKLMMKNDLNCTNMADYFLVPSNFVKESLLFCNVKNDAIAVVPYGVDREKFSMKDTLNNDKKLNIIYVGQVSYRKGIHRLLEVISQLDKNSIHLNICGGYDKNSDIYIKYKSLENVDFKGYVTRDCLAEEYRKSDLFVFPTLGEGFGLVVLEALSCGLPVLCSSRAGGNDVIKEGYNGYVISMDDNNELLERIQWCINNKDKIRNMKSNAIESVKYYTWDNYYSKVVYEIKKFLKIEKDL